MTENDAEYVKKRLIEVAKNGPQHMDMQRLMTRYAIERFMWRIGRSPHADRFTLKGAMAFTYYVTNSSRTTRDIDFLMRGEYSPDSIKGVLSEIAAISVPDGITFSANAITVSRAGAERAYPSYSAKVPARLGTSPCHIQLDISFGEAVHPDPKRVTIPSLVVDRSLYPVLRVYPIETIIAEKYHTIVRLGSGNTRLKDHHDLYEISLSLPVMGASLQSAIRATFERRGTRVDAGVPTGLAEDFYMDKSKQREWKATLAAHGMPRGTSLQQACDAVVRMIGPVISATVNSHEFAMNWRDSEWESVPR